MSDNPNLPSLTTQTKSTKAPILQTSTGLLAKNSHPQLPRRIPLSPKTPTHQKIFTTPFPIHISHKHLSDKDLYSRCQLYGSNAKKWLQKFAGLLPEVYRRFLYKKHGCGSIQEFAQKLSGMHERTTDKILNLHKRLEDKPHLLALFESGEQGWSKLQSVAFIATPETEEDFAEKVKTLPKKALEIYVKVQREKLTPGGQAQNDLRIWQGHASDQLPLLQETNGLPSPELTSSNLGSNPTLPPIQATQAASHHSTVLLDAEPSPNSNPISGLPSASAFGQPLTGTPPYHETFTNFSFPVSTRSRQKLNIVKLTLEKQHGQTLTWNQVIELWPIHNQKIIVKKACPTCALKLAKNPSPTCPSPLSPSSVLTKTQPPINQRSRSTSTSSSPHALQPGTTSRHIPESIKHLILSTHGQTCVFPGCNQAFTDFHHIEPFAIHKTHDPNHIYPVCSTHHTLFHAGLIANSKKRPEFWYIQNKAVQNSIDKKVMKFKVKG